MKIEIYVGKSIQVYEQKFKLRNFEENIIQLVLFFELGIV